MAKQNEAVRKAQLIDELSAETTIPKTQCDFMYEVLLDIIKRHLMNEDEVWLKYLGQFYYVPHRPKRSNMTGAIIPKHKQLKFRINDSLARFIRTRTREFE